MFASQQLLIIASDREIIPSDDFLFKTAFQLLNAEKPPQWRIAIEKLAKGFIPYNAASAFFTSNQNLPEDPETRGMVITFAKPLVVELLRAIYARDIKLVLPEALVLPPSDSRLSRFTCPDTSFMTHTTYVRHPTDPNFFIKLADFHSYLIQEKRCEFFRLAASLGAREVRLVDSKEKTTSGYASTSVKEPTSTVNVEANVSTNKQEKNSFDLSASFSCAGEQPSIPDGLRWLGTEPLWQAMAESRLKHWVEKFKVSFTYCQDFNVNTSLVAKISDMGLSAGGNFSDIQRVDQDYLVEFFPRSDYEP